MEKMKGNIIMALFLLLPVGLNAQDPVARIWNEIDSIEANTRIQESPAKVTPWSFHTTVGTSFGYNPYFGSSMQLFTTPHVTYAAGERLAFHGGLMISRTSPLMTTQTAEFNNITGFTGVSAYASASYRIGENLYIHGTGMKTMALLPPDSDVPALQYYDFSFGATYDFGNFSIGASIHRSDRPLYGPPFGNGMYGSPTFW